MPVTSSTFSTDSGHKGRSSRNASNTDAWLLPIKRPNADCEPTFRTASASGVSRRDSIPMRPTYWNSFSEVNGIFGCDAIGVPLSSAG